jgi:hypothetical protein
VKRVRVLSLAFSVFAMVATLPGPRPSAAEPRSALERSGCERAVARTASAVGTTSCPGVRPGALVRVPAADAVCTLGFVHYDDKKQWYIATAGHCAFPDGADDIVKVWAPGTGPVAYTSNNKPIGRFVFAGLRGDLDFAVIQISKGVTPKAQVCHFGGPTGVSTSRTSSLVQVEFYGNADGASLILPARSGVAMGMRDEDYVYALSPSWFGDSGGPVMTASSGRAIGHTVGIGYAISIGTDPYAGATFIARHGPQVSQAQKYLHKKLYLRTAPRL